MPTINIPNPAYEVEDNVPEYLSLLAKYEVCPTCRGNGKHSNHLGAFTQSDIDEMGEDWLHDYMAGEFDKVCENCKGQRVVAVIDRENNSEKNLKLYDTWEEEEYRYRHESEMEMRYTTSDYY